MKKFAIVLMMALLVLGCVFAASGDSQKTDTNAANSGDKFVVTTTIGKIYPVYQIVGTNNASGSATSKHESETLEKVEGILSADGNSISINVALNHFGKVDNDLDTGKAMTDIRYKGEVTVTITGYALKNVSNTSDTTGHVQSSALPTAGTFTAVSSIENFEATTAISNNIATITAKYLNGKKVASGTGVQTIANGSFTWDISEFTAGDTYEADVVVTYTNET